MKIYLGIKYHADNKNRELIEGLCNHLENQGHTAICVVKDIEEWGKKSFKPSELMQKSFKLIDCSDAVLIDLTEKGVGIGIEAGYAYSKNIPIHTIAKLGSDISSTLEGISRSTLLYENIQQVTISSCPS